MVSNVNLYIANVWARTGYFGLTIALALTILLFVLLALYFNTRWYSNGFNCCNDQFSLPQSNHQLSNKFFPDLETETKGLSAPQPNQLLETLKSQDSKHCNINLHSPIGNQNAPQLPDKNKIVVRNRGSCASSSDSTTSGSFEDEMTFLRHRDTRYSRPFCFQDAILMERDHPLIPSPQNRDCVVVLQQDQLSDVQNVFEDSINGIVGKCGLLEVAFAYDAPVRKMTIHILQARDIPVKDHGKPSCTQIHAVLLPGKKQKQKSKFRSGDNPQYMETFTFNRIAPEEVNNLSIRFRLYGYERMRRQRIIGECIISFANINLQLHTNLWIPLEHRANTVINAQACEVLSLAQSDSTGSMQSMQHGGVPELFIGLSYNGTTGRLSVEIIKGSHFRHVSATRAPDTYVKLLLLSSTGQEIARSKTTVRRCQTNPLFKEQFMYQVALFQLSDVTLMIMVYTKKAIKKRERIGWFSLGKTTSSEAEYSHWQDMKLYKGDQLSRWHILVET